VDWAQAVDWAGRMDRAVGTGGGLSRAVKYAGRWNVGAVGWGGSASRIRGGVVPDGRARRSRVVQ